MGDINKCHLSSEASDITRLTVAATFEEFWIREASDSIIKPAVLVLVNVPLTVSALPVAIVTTAPEAMVRFLQTAGVPGALFTIGWFDGALGMVTFLNELGTAYSLQLPAVFQSPLLAPVHVSKGIF